MLLFMFDIRLEYTPVQIGDTTVGVRIAIKDMVMPAESQIYSWGIKSPGLGRWQPGENLPVRRCLISRGNRRLLGRCKALAKRWQLSRRCLIRGVGSFRFHYQYTHNGAGCQVSPHAGCVD